MYTIIELGRNVKGFYPNSVLDFLKRERVSQSNKDCKKIIKNLQIENQKRNQKRNHYYIVININNLTIKTAYCLIENKIRKFKNVYSLIELENLIS